MVEGGRTAGDGEEFLSLEEAARFLGASKPTVYRWLAQHELQGFRAGRKWRFRKADLVAFLSRRPLAVAAPEDALQAQLEWLAAELARLGGALRPASDYGDEDGMRRLIEGLADLGVLSRASDIHVEPERPGQEGCTGIRLRVDGVLQQARRMPSSLHEPLVASLKLLTNMDTAERHLPQQGRYRLVRADGEYDLRIAVGPTIGGEEVVMRILDRNAGLVTGLENLGWDAERGERLRAIVRRPNGIVLVAGPAGSGKTTLLYGLIMELAGEQVKTLSIEEPVEYRLPHVTQVQVNPRAGLTYPVAVRALLRHDPDVLALGEIADLPTALAAQEAALTGHLVLSTLFAPSAAAAFRRLLDLGVEPFVLAADTLAVVGMRLVRRLCEQCREPYRIQACELARFGFDVEHPDQEVTIYRARGCDTCRGMGYRRRLPLYELLEVTPSVAAAIGRSATAEEIHEAAIASDMRSLREDGLQRVLEGLTTPEEVMRVLYAAPD